MAVASAALTSSKMRTREKFITPALPVSYSITLRADAATTKIDYNGFLTV